MTDKFKFDPEHTFFTSDTHFGHANIINLCNRPFKDVNHMNDMLVENWNSVVTDDDTVFHLGDFALGGSAVWSNVLSRLKGKIYLILGNHDRKNIRQGYMGKLEIVVPQMQISIETRSIYLNHYPFLCYGGIYRKKRMPYGSYLDMYIQAQIVLELMQLDCLIYFQPSMM